MMSVRTPTTNTVSNLAHPEAESEARNERSPWLEIRCQEVEQPPEQRANIWGARYPRGVFSVEKVLEATSSAVPVDAHERYGAQVLRGQSVSDNCATLMLR